jgi:hypothetical protein
MKWSGSYATWRKSRKMGHPCWTLERIRMLLGRWLTSRWVNAVIADLSFVDLSIVGRLFPSVFKFIQLLHASHSKPLESHGFSGLKQSIYFIYFLIFNFRRPLLRNWRMRSEKSTKIHIHLNGTCWFWASCARSCGRRKFSWTRSVVGPCFLWMSASSLRSKTSSLVQLHRVSLHVTLSLFHSWWLTPFTVESACSKSGCSKLMLSILL